VVNAALIRPPLTRPERLGPWQDRQRSRQGFALPV